MTRIYPSLISADLLNLKNVMNSLDPYCQGYHIDIMDNHFVPNLTWGADFTNALALTTLRQIWVHLMVSSPESVIDHLTLPVGSIVTFHIEAVPEPHKLITHIQSRGWQTSLALKPATPITAAYPFLSILDQVLIMSVEPGFSGQEFLPQTWQRLPELTSYKEQNRLTCKVAVDGGINKTNIEQLIAYGAQDFAIASAIFHAQNPSLALQELQALGKQ